MGCIPWIILCLCRGFLYLRDAGRRGNKITALNWYQRLLHPWRFVLFFKSIRLESSEKIRASRCNSNSYRQCHIFIQNVRIFLLHMPELRKLYLETGTNNSIMHFLWIPFLVVLGFAGLPDSDQKTASPSFRQHILAKYPLPVGKIIK